MPRVSPNQDGMMCYQLISWLWRVTGKTPRYKIQRQRSVLNFGPKYLYRVYDNQIHDYILEAPRTSVVNLLNSEDAKVINNLGLYIRKAMKIHDG